MTVQRLCDARPDIVRDLPHMLNSYRAAAALVAASADRQQQWIRSFPFDARPDVLLQNLDEAIASLQQWLVRAAVLTVGTVDAVARILGYCDSWKDADLWESADALNRAEWQELRKIAAAALVLVDDCADSFARNGCVGAAVPGEV